MCFFFPLLREVTLISQLTHRFFRSQRSARGPRASLSLPAKSKWGETAERQEAPHPNRKVKTGTQLQKSFSILLGISDAGELELKFFFLCVKREGCMNRNDSDCWLVAIWPLIEANCCSFHCPCWNEFKTAQPVSLLSHIPPSWLPEWKGQRKGQEMVQEV